MTELINIAKRQNPRLGGIGRFALLNVGGKLYSFYTDGSFYWGVAEL